MGLQRIKRKHSSAAAALRRESQSSTQESLRAVEGRGRERERGEETSRGGDQLTGVEWST